MPLAVVSDLQRIEAVECGSEVLALLQDDSPTEACLHRVENHELKQLPVIVYGHAPLSVMIGDHHRIASDPTAASIAHGTRIVGLGETLTFLSPRAHGLMPVLAFH